MKKSYHIYKWKPYMWVLFNKERQHHDMSPQEAFYPSFYDFLKKYKKHDNVIITLSDEKINKYTYHLMIKEKHNKYTIYDDYIISNKELIDIFKYIPQEIYLEIN